MPVRGGVDGASEMVLDGAVNCYKTPKRLKRKTAKANYSILQKGKTVTERGESRAATPTQGGVVLGLLDSRKKAMVFKGDEILGEKFPMAKPLLDRQPVVSRAQGSTSKKKEDT